MTSAWPSLWRILLALALFAPAVGAVDDNGAEDARPEVLLWHAYRAEEAAVLEEIVVDINATRTDMRVKMLAVPYDAYLDKITAAIPRGKGPDVFIAAHDRIGDWAEAKTIQPVDDLVDPATAKTLVDGLMPAMLYKEHVYAVPLAFKSLALWRNTTQAQDAPKTFDDLVTVAKQNTTSASADDSEGSGAKRYGLVYENRDLYFHAPFLFGEGGRLFNDDGSAAVDNANNVASVRRAMALQQQGILPAEISGTLTTSLFNDGKATFILSGPWTLGEMNPGLVFAVSPLPTVTGADGVNRPMRPFLTVEAAFVSGQTQKRALAATLIGLLTNAHNSQKRLMKARQPVAQQGAWDELKKSGVDDVYSRALLGFLAQQKTAVATPNTPAMKALWGPFNLALGESLGQGTDPQTTLAAAKEKLAGVMKEVEPRQEPVDVTGFVLVLGLIGAGLVVVAARQVLKAGGPGQVLADIRQNGGAYLYVAPAMLGTALLVFVPFVTGIGMGFFKHTWGTYTFVGLDNFKAILLSTDTTFFRILAMTILWTFSNVFLHLVIGVFLALILSQAKLRFKTFYRVLFIIPWAVPSYITALIWKGMFHPEFGAVNQILGIPGFSWMNETWSAFLANLITNTWLGFPFMMVTALGGLTAIPGDLYEAAALDGASAWTRFTRITLPLLRPTLVPAVVLGTVWTFNMFNIIYLVSGGAPGGTTDILITEAFRWAFERGPGGAFGMAAAYSTLIFLMLLGYNIASSRVTRAMEVE